MNVVIGDGTIGEKYFARGSSVVFVKFAHGFTACFRSEETRVTFAVTIVGHAAAATKCYE